MAGELNIYQKLNLVQIELKAPKGQRNNFGKYNYRNAEDILEAVKPLNHKYGLNLTMSDDTKIESNGWAYLVATGILVNIDNPHEKIDATGRAREAQAKKGMDESQITGTASSYARKYMLNGLYLIDDTKDADTDQYHKQQAAPQEQQQPQQSQLPPENQQFDEKEGKKHFLNNSYNEFFKNHMTAQEYGATLANAIGVQDIFDAHLSALVESSKFLRKQIQAKQDQPKQPQNDFKWGQ